MTAAAAPKKVVRVHRGFTDRIRPRAKVAKPTPTTDQECHDAAKLLHEGSGYAVTKADIRCDGKLACNAEITFRLVEFPNAEFRASMEKMAAILEFPRGTLAHG